MAVLREPKDDVIDAGALRSTWITGAVAGVGALVVAFNEHFLKIFGDHVGDSTKAAVLIALVAAWAVIGAADLIARSTATAASLSSRRVMAAPPGLTVKTTEGDDESGWKVAAIDPGARDAEALWLLLKTGKAPQWVKTSEIRGQ